MLNSDPYINICIYIFNLFINHNCNITCMSSEIIMYFIIAIYHYNTHVFTIGKTIDLNPICRRAKCRVYLVLATRRLLIITNTPKIININYFSNDYAFCGTPHCMCSNASKGVPKNLRPKASVQ